MKIKQFFKSIDYRHYICLAITIGFLLCTLLVFSSAIGRIIEALRDLGLSVAYYFCTLCGIDSGITPTVNSFPKPFEWLPDISPVPLLPESWAAFKVSFVEFWRLFADKSNFTGYVPHIIKDILIIVIIAIPILIVLFVLKLLISKYTRTECPETKDSKPLKAFKKLSARTYQPVKLWLQSFWEFLKDRRGWLVTWGVIWAFNFNVFTIIIEAIAYILIFPFTITSADLYSQFYKLAYDLTPLFTAVPWWVWVIGVFVLLYAIARKIGYNRLYHNERKNRGFINERGVVTLVYGAMGVGKTTAITDIALSCEVQILDDMLDIIMETDKWFPYFPFRKFERALQYAVEQKYICDVWSCKAWVQELERAFDRFNECVDNDDAEGKSAVLAYLAERFNITCDNAFFDYDYTRYGLTYNNKLEVIDIWQALIEYAQAYFIYTVQSSYIISNYSIRSDKLKMDCGNFPVWNTDFFKRDSRIMNATSRYSHIIDYDMFRLGVKMIEDNPNRNALGFGVYVITELDKERKNTPELKGVEKNSAECNQKNDLYASCVKMLRHAVVIRNRVPVKMLADMQRLGSLGADNADLGEKLAIHDKGDMKATLPFFSPFYLIEGLYEFLLGKYREFWLNYNFTRSDNTLFMHIVKTVVDRLGSYVERVHNTFDCQTLNLVLEKTLNGVDGEAEKCKYYRMPKKIYSRRFRTDCLSAIFETRAEQNSVSLDDLAEYGDIMATQEELAKQNSHFQAEISKIFTSS